MLKLDLNPILKAPAYLSALYFSKEERIHTQYYHQTAFG